MHTPPLVGSGLRPALRRVFPRFLTTVRSEVEQSKMRVEQLAATVGGEVCTVNAVLVITNEHVNSKPLPRIEIIGETTVMIGVPRRFPPHPLLQGNDLIL